VDFREALREVLFRHGIKAVDLCEAAARLTDGKIRPTPSRLGQYRSLDPDKQVDIHSETLQALVNALPYEAQVQFLLLLLSQVSQKPIQYLQPLAQVVARTEPGDGVG